ncbi:hypothetical protein BpHYR1_017505 [Brachionus plicatilis]|uniref:Uncharacterized protein n=1 Tax=Brachionus plicatilis TaxID=10195 RepID=A0A3M7RLT0_BRAPC|nr:hypothetical protein BpHYR1_017505 [Brachionus plicatilis]
MFQAIFNTRIEVGVFIMLRTIFEVKDSLYWKKGRNYLVPSREDMIPKHTKWHDDKLALYLLLDSIKHQSFYRMSRKVAEKIEAIN